MAVFIDPVDVSPGTLNSYVDIDVSAHVSAAATGIMLRMVNLSAGTALAFVRPNGSTAWPTFEPSTGTHAMLYCGVVSGIFEIYSDDADLIFYLEGYFEEDAEFYINPPALETSEVDTWTDVDITPHTTGTPIAALLSNYCSNSTKLLGIRKKGSTDTFIDSPLGGVGLIVAVDAAQKYQEYQTWVSGCDVYLMGSLLSDAVIHTNRINRSLTTTGSYTNLTALPSGAIGASYYIDNTSPATLRSFNLRKEGASRPDYYYDFKDAGHLSVELNSSQICEGKIETTAVDFYEIGYFEGVIGGPAPVSNSIASSFTALTVASQAITLSYESSQNLDALLAPAFESVVSVSDTVVANVESTSSLTVEQLTPFNALANIDVDYAGMLESLVKIAGVDQPGFESQAQRVGFVNVNYESAASATAVANPISSSFTALAVASRAISLPIESTQSLESLLAPAFETVVSVNDTVAVSVESSSILTVEQATPIHSLATIKTSQGSALESLLNVDGSVLSPFESLEQAVSSVDVNHESDSASLPVSRSISALIESLSQSANNLSVNFESNTSAVAVSNSAGVSFESLSGLEKFSGSPYAALRGFARGIDGNLEAVATLVVAGDAAAEALVSTGNSKQVNFELLQLLQQASAVPLEAAGLDFIPSYLDLVMILSDEVNITAELSDEINLNG